MFRIAVIELQEQSALMSLPPFAPGGSFLELIDLGAGKKEREHICMYSLFVGGERLELPTPSV